MNIQPTIPVALIAAVAENGVIGRAGTMPWHVSSDLKYFRRVTTGKPVIMGRKTFESIGRPLPQRLNIIVTRQLDFAAPGIVVTHDLYAALAHAEAEIATGNAQMTPKSW